MSQPRHADQREHVGPSTAKQRFPRRSFLLSGCALVLIVLIGCFGWPGWLRTNPPAESQTTQADDTGAARLAQAYVDATSRKDLSAMRGLLCERLDRQLGAGNTALGGYSEMIKNSRISAQLVGKSAVKGNTATATMRESVRGSGMNVDLTVLITMNRNGANWLVCGLTPEQPPAGGPSGAG